MRLLVLYYLEGTKVMYKYWKNLKKPWFEMFRKAQEVNVKIVMEPLRKSKEILSTQNLMILRNF